MNTTDIVKTIGSKIHVDNIVNKFIETQTIYFNNQISNQQLSNIKKLAKLLYCDNQNDVNKVIVADIPMGQGKSTLLIEFIRYMYETDSEFGCIVVKKTLAECEEFCILLGMDSSNEKYSDIFCQINSLPDYNERLKTLKDYYYKGRYDSVKSTEGAFIARVIRGFNFNDCKKYTDKSKVAFGEVGDAVEYDYRLCSHCSDNSCPVKLSKWASSKHRVIAITHNRLFFSSDHKELLDNLKEFSDYEGNTKKRTLLIIDEKLDTVDINGINYPSFTRLKNFVVQNEHEEYKKLFQDIDNYLVGLNYPKTVRDFVIKQESVFRDNFQFDDGLLKLLLNNPKVSLEDIRNFSTLQKVLSSKNVSTCREYPSKNLKVSHYNYIDLNEYNKEFNKTIILDATTKYDFDYTKSNVTFVDDIQQSKQEIVLYVPKYNFSISKSHITGKGNDFKSKKEREQYYWNSVNTISYELENLINTVIKKDTLIVVYKTVETYKFKDDIVSTLKSLSVDYKFKVIHHGEFSTGVNHLSNYENIIILGQLNKSHIYYQNKGLALDISMSEFGKVQTNDYLIQTIQQIGRTSLRKNKIVNVFLLCDEPMLVSQIKKYFTVTPKEYTCIYYKHELSATDRIVEAIKQENLEFGDTVAKSLIAKKAHVDSDTLRKDYILNALYEVGIVRDEDNNRLFKKVLKQ